ncbi:hypothetical protein [Saccharomonospora piscinae]|uniref:hypothetical protein n=1 Tax=Saccharomonospora piscinae TaxID=687388 RepID=UPI001FC949F2|nr:hypothetical protein [Saccharomonospora piscinae]
MTGPPPQATAPPAPPAPQAPGALPQRPRLRRGLPVVERRADELQIGLDPRHAVVATDVPPVLVDVLRSLDGRRSTATLLDLVSVEHEDRLCAVLVELAERGLVEDIEQGDTRPGSASSTTARHSAPGLARCSIGVFGSGRLAAAVTSLLAAAGAGRLDLAADGVVAEADLGSGFQDDDLGHDRQAALGHVARRTHPEVRLGRLRPERANDVVVLTDAVVPAPEVVTGLVAAGTPHLVARVRDGIGIVGPLVVPGRSSCLRCADLHRTGLDACWPRIAGQLAGHYQDADLTSVHGTAALAAGQVRCALSAHGTTPTTSTPPPTWNATLELDCLTGTVTRREWPPHPHCGCGARRHRARH